MSETYADLGGGIRSYTQRPAARIVPQRARHSDEPHVCRFEQPSGYCACGIRDDGTLAEDSPAWRAQRDLAGVPNGTPDAARVAGGRVAPESP